MTPGRRQGVAAYFKDTEGNLLGLGSRPDDQGGTHASTAASHRHDDQPSTSSALI